MLWFAAAIVCAVVITIAFRIWRNWFRPWREIEELLRDVTAARQPRTFLIDGNSFARRIGLALEDLFLRQRDLARRAEEDEFNIRMILGAMRDGLAVVDRDGIVRSLNLALQKLFGLDESRVGKNLLETFADPLVAELVTRTLRQGETANDSINLRGVSEAGDRRVAVTSLPMRDENGAMRGAIILFHDETQLQQLEQVRRDFVSNVSHELRTPLSIFRGYLETLIDEPDLSPQERQNIFRLLEKHSTRLQSLVDDLLSLARLEAPDPQLTLAPVSLEGFIRHASRDWEKKAAAKQLRIVAEVEKNLPAILADEARLEEIIYNLLDNAVKYSNAGGCITIRISRNQNGTISVAVIDEGSGIAAADLPRIFERFYRADKARSRELGGTGLGLAIVKHIAQLHGGSVAAQSQPGRGTTLCVTLPLSSENAAAGEFTRL